MKKQKFTGEKGITLGSTNYRFEYQDRTPENAPNVVYIVMDDMGFAHLGCYGSNIHTPNLDRLANEGLRYNNFHTTAICSATRACLLTGMNHHTAGISNLVEFVTGCENGAGHVHADCATLAEILKEYDYGTCAVGKWHLADLPETTEAGPFENWPLGKGFDKFYGFMHGEMDQYNPRLFRDNSPVDPPKTPEEGYHLSEDITDEAIKYVFHQKAAYPEKPFFLYVAYGAMHTPHHAPKEYIERYKGRFDAGWDVIRRQWFERQKELGVIPREAELTPRNEMVPAWEDLTENQKKVYARYMEAFAGMLEHTDAQIGRLLEYLRTIGELDNTIVVFLSDNGASAEGGAKGAINSFREVSDNTMNGAEEEAEYVLSRLDDIGSPRAFNHYPTGWANAGNTPFPWYKTYTYSGGVKDAMVVRYPKLITDPGAVRNQYHHVSDVTPTILDIIGIRKPETIKGVYQKEFQGTSFKYTLEDGSAEGRKHIQYYEILGNRAIYKDGWKAITNHTNHSVNGRVEDDVWELYHVAEDYSECHNVAEQYPEKVRELDREFFIQAARADVFPIPSGAEMSSQNPVLFQLMRQKERFRVYREIVEPFSLIRAFYTDLNVRPHVVRVKLYRDTEEQQGVILSSGNYHGGFSLYVQNNRLKYTYNFGSEKYYTVESDVELPVGEVNLEYRFKSHKDLSAKVELFIGERKTAELEIGKILTFVDFITTVGDNKHSSVAPDDYASPFPFEGKLKEVGIYVEGHTTTLDRELELFFAAD